VLAGGGSTRFGSDKLAEPLDGSPLLNHAVERLSEVCDDVVVVLAPGDERLDLPPGIRVAHDRVEGQGPLAGLHEGLLSVAAADVALVVGGDMPRIQVEVLRQMLDALWDEDIAAVVLEDAGRYRPLPMAVRTWSAAEATHALLHAGARRLTDLLDVLGPRVIEEGRWTSLDPRRLTLTDVDEPSDMP